MYRSKPQRYLSQHEINNRPQTSIPLYKSRSQSDTFLLDKYFSSTASYRSVSSLNSSRNVQTLDISNSQDLFADEQNTSAGTKNQSKSFIDLTDDISSIKSNKIKSESVELYLSDTTLGSNELQKKEKKRLRRKSRAELSKIIENDSFHSATSQISTYSPQTNSDNRCSALSLESTLVYSKQTVATITQETTLWSEVSLKKAQKCTNRKRSKSLLIESSSKVLQTEKTITNASYPGSSKQDKNKELLTKKKQQSNIPQKPKKGKTRSRSLSVKGDEIDVNMPLSQKLTEFLETRRASKRKLPGSSCVEGDRSHEKYDMPLSQNLLEFLDTRRTNEVKRTLQKPSKSSTAEVRTKKSSMEKNKMKAEAEKKKTSVASKNSKTEKNRKKAAKNMKEFDNTMPLSQKIKEATQHMSLPVDDRNISLSQLILSQPPTQFTHRERLQWLQNRRGAGTYIECTRPKCRKWRYLPTVTEPIEVPEEWVCSMNPDKNWASCSIPEQVLSLSIQLDLIHIKYTAGSVVWAKAKGWPWWPVMIDDDPDTEQYYWLESDFNHPDAYNGTYFDSAAVTRTWFDVESIRPFKTGKEFPIKSSKHKLRLKKAVHDALKALKLNIRDRLKKYSFLSRYKGPINDPVEVEFESGDETVYDNLILPKRKKYTLRRSGSRILAHGVTVDYTEDANIVCTF